MSSKDDDPGEIESVKPTRWYRLALLCGLVPMTLGTADFVLWFFTNLDFLALIGIYIAIGGTVLFLVGVACTVIFVARVGTLKNPYVRAITAAVILFLNFPLCAVYFFVALEMLSTSFVTIENDSDSPIKELVFTDPTGQDFLVELIESGGVSTACFNFEGEGAVTFSLRAAKKAHNGLLHGYIPVPFGINATLNISKELKIGVTEKFERIAGSAFLRHCILDSWL